MYSHKTIIFSRGGKKKWGFCHCWVASTRQSERERRAISLRMQ